MPNPLVKMFPIVYAKRDRGQYTKRIADYYLRSRFFPEKNEIVFDR